MLTGRGYFPAGQSCLEAVINEAQLSGGFPRASILAKTVTDRSCSPRTAACVGH